MISDEAIKRFDKFSCFKAPLMIALRWLDPNDYLGTVFDHVVSCRNNFLPRSPREKLQLVIILQGRNVQFVNLP